MSLDEFVAMLADYRGDLDLMARGHPFSSDEIEEAMYAAESDSAEMVVLKKLLSHAQQ